MKLSKLNEKIIGEDGLKPVPNELTKGAPLTFKDVCTRSLLAVLYDERGKPEEDKAKLEKWDLYKKIRDAKGEAEVTLEEGALLKKWIGYWQPQLIMGQCYDILESIGFIDEKKKK